MITYEIVAYETQQDFDNRTGIVIDDGITSKKEALKTAKEDYESGLYLSVKCQSSDREFIQMFPPVFKTI